MLKPLRSTSKKIKAHGPTIKRSPVWLLMVLASLMGSGCVESSLAAESADVLTWHNDNARTGQMLHEKTLTPASVSVRTFGRLFTIPADGKVDATPLYARGVKVGHSSKNVVFIATEHDSV
jgi:hypothetical protein